MESKLAIHSSVISDLQPQLQQIWQEQLDRVRRQQFIFREKIEATISLRVNAHHVTCAARQLEPFATCLTAVTSVIDWKRCHPPDPAPMETICLQINTLEPDSQQRIEAIEKEESNRKKAQDEKRREEQEKFAAVKKHLKTTKEQKRRAKNVGEGHPMLNLNRDRSPGGTDRALVSPCFRRRKRSLSDSADPGFSTDGLFEFTAKISSAEATTTRTEYEHELCRLDIIASTAPLNINEKRASSSSLSNSGEIIQCTDKMLPEKSEAQHSLRKSARSEDGKTVRSAASAVPILSKTITMDANSVQPAKDPRKLHEMILESLKQKVSGGKVGAARSLDRRNEET